MHQKGCLNCWVDVYSLDEESDSGVWSKMYTIESITICNQQCWLSNCFRTGGEILTRCYCYTPSLVCLQGKESIVYFSSQEMHLKELAIEYSNLIKRSGSSSDSSSSSSGIRKY